MIAVDESTDEKGEIRIDVRPSAESEKAVATQLELAKLFKEINLRVGQGVDYQSILDFAFDSLKLWVPFDRIGIALVDDSESEVSSAWTKSKSPVNSLTASHKASLKGSSLEHVLKTKCPRIISDLEKYFADHPDSKSTELALADGIRSSLTCPLIAGNKPIGFVFFSSLQPHTYHAGHLEVLTDISAGISLIIDKARLQRFFDENRDRVRTLNSAIHDLRSPLSVMRGFLDLTYHQAWYEELDGKAKDILHILSRNSDFMLSLLDDLQQVAVYNGTPQAFSVVNLREFLHEVLRDGALLAARKEIRLRDEIDPWLPKDCRFNPQGLRRVIENLFSNAFKYSAPKTEVCFKVLSQGTKILFSVEDQGQGIHESELGSLFKEFGRASSKPTGGEFSTGLGLFITRRIIENHGGRIWVQSQVGKGSAFYFEIPVNPDV